MLFTYVAAIYGFLARPDAVSCTVHVNSERETLVLNLKSSVPTLKNKRLRAIQVPSLENKELIHVHVTYNNIFMLFSLSPPPSPHMAV